MTDLRITDEVDRDMVRAMEAYGDDPTPEPTPAPTVDDATIALLKRYGFDHVPTVEELRERKAQRQAEVREEVLFQADRRFWCDDGTRQVCANLRIPRPGAKQTHRIKAQISFEVVYDAHTWTQRGALAVAIGNGVLPNSGNWNGARVDNVTITDLTVGDTAYELTDDLRKELTNGTSD